MNKYDRVIHKIAKLNQKHCDMIGLSFTENYDYHVKQARQSTKGWPLAKLIDYAKWLESFTEVTVEIRKKVNELMKEEI